MPDHEDRNFWERPLQELLSTLDTSPKGLTSAQAKSRIAKYGPNSLGRDSHYYALREFLRFFLNPLVLILLAASAVSISVGEVLNASIIIAMVFLSVSLNFYQEFQARRAVESLRNQVATTAEVLRDGKSRELPVASLVPGDIVILNAGDLVPADGRLIETKDLHVRESALTGESLPVEKTAGDLSGGPHNIVDAENSVFMGTSVESGMGTVVIVFTGAKTEFGAIAADLAQRPPETEFDRGMRQFGLMITRVILGLVLFVFLVNIAFHRAALDSLLFALALAVGLTPELLPVIISITLGKGAKRMAAKKVIVKQLASIENFGSMEILCSDKTGTLTEGDIVLDKHVNVEGEQDANVLKMIYVNSHYESGIKSPLDDAILRHEHPNVDSEFQKVDEMPFDFQRRRLSVVVQHGDERLLITKGAAETLFDTCSSVNLGGKVQDFTESSRKIAAAEYESLSRDGYRVLGVAVRSLTVKDAYTNDDEKEMTLIGFAAFLDPAKADVGKTLRALEADGISVVIMTGDNQFVTEKIAKDVGLRADRIILGTEVDTMNDAALSFHAQQGAIFARVSPEQKNRVIRSLKAFGKVVGYLGDGINDAPSLHAADIGVSVVNGVDVAKEAAKIILLEKDLGVLHEGVIEGRRSFANILKYIIMGTSSNFGNMCSMAAASLFLPFLPMLPTQILLNNFLYDSSQVAIPSDTVDPALLRRPKRWRIDFVRQFMVIIGPISSIYDFLTFGTLLWVFHADQALFHTGWFVESLATQTLVVFVIRSTGNPFKSRPSKQLAATVLGIVVLGFILPFTGFGRLLGFVPLPMKLQGVIVLFIITYLGLVQAVKMRFYKKHSLI